MRNPFRIFQRKPKLAETTQLTAENIIAALLQYVTGQQRDMPDTARAETTEQAYNAYRTNPMAFNFVNSRSSFLFGPGVQFSHPDDATQERLSEFLRDSKFGRKLIELGNGYFIDGVRFPVGYANVLTGEVKVREYDPATIKNIVTEDGDYDTIIGLYREYKERVWAEDGKRYKEEQKTEYIKQDERDGYTVRHFFVWKRPTVAGETRGWSFLTPVLHYLVQFREFLKARLQLQKALAAFAWKYSLKGLTGSNQQKLAEAQAFQTAVEALGGIHAGSQIVVAPGDDRNAGFDLEAITSGVTAGRAGAEGDALVLGRQIAVGLSTPEGIALGDWSNANYSSTTWAMQAGIKPIQAEQTIWGMDGFLGEFFDWWLEIQRDAGLISEEASKMPVNITWPVIIPFDLTELKNIIEFLRSEGIITKRSALSITPFDLDYDAEQEEIDRLKKEREAEQAKKKAEEPLPAVPVPPTQPAPVPQPPAAVPPPQPEAAATK